MGDQDQAEWQKAASQQWQEAPKGSAPMFLLVVPGLPISLSYILHLSGCPTVHFHGPHQPAQAVLHSLPTHSSYHETSETLL